MFATRLRMVLWGACAVSVFYNTDLCGATRFLADGFENGLGAWSVNPATSSIDRTFVHSGTCSHRVVHASNPNSTARLSFKHPASQKLFVRFFYMMRDMSSGPGKIGRLKAAGGSAVVSMECWYSPEYATGLFWYADGTTLINSDKGRWPGNCVSEQNVWHKYELFIEYNDPEAANGRLRLWIDRPDATAFESADAYKSIDVQNCQFRNTVRNIPYETLDLPTGFMNVGGAFYFDDLELWDGLPDLLPPPRPEDSPPPSAPKIQIDY